MALCRNNAVSWVCPVCRHNDSPPVPLSRIFSTFIIQCDPQSQVGLFREDDSESQEVIGFMLNSFEDGFGIFLPPAGSTPSTLASVLLHFLVTLPEPLLTFKCARCAASLQDKFSGLVEQISASNALVFMPAMAES